MKNLGVGVGLSWFVGALLFACSSSDGGSSTSSSSNVAGSGGQVIPSSAGASGAATNGGGGAAGKTDTAGAGGSSAGAANAGAPSSAGAGVISSTTCSGTASYRITLSLTWDDSNVTGRHYTTIIGAIHASKVSFWQLSGMATEGIREMAEQGATAVLTQEVQAAIAAGTAKSVISFNGGNAPGMSTGVVEVSPDFPLVTFGSMIAPSPDWFVGVSALDLCEAGAWAATKSLPAVVYDAGTKDGQDFDYGFPETSPQAPIGYSVKFPNQTPAGVITFDRQ